MGPGNPLFLQSGNHQVLFSLDMTHPRDYAQQYNLGFEYSLSDMVFLRAGYKMNYDEEGLTFGVGLNLSHFVVDYSFNDYGDYLESVNRFTFRFFME